MELMAGHGEHVDIHGLDVDGHVPRGLNGVGVEWNTALTADRADLGDGLHGADLIVGEHHGHKTCILADSVAQLVNADYTVLMDVQQRDLPALFFKLLESVQHGVMLKLGGDDVLLALLRAELRGGNYGLIVRLAAAGGEVYLTRLGVDALGNGGSSVCEILGDYLCEGVQAGGIAVSLGEVGHHRLACGLADAGSGCVVGIYEHGFLSFLCCIKDF